MARYENGINGNIPQQSHAYVQHGFNLSNKVLPNNNPNIYSFDDTQQVVPDPYATQVYSASPNHILANSMSPISPLVTQGPYAIFQYPQSFQTHTSQFNPYAQQFIHTQQYPYNQEPQSTSINSYPQTNRKSKPLVVLDPINKTDLDLSKYRNQESKDKRNHGLLGNEKICNTVKNEGEEIRSNVPSQEMEAVGNISTEMNIDDKYPENKSEVLLDIEKESILREDFLINVQSEKFQTEENILNDKKENFKHTETKIEHNSDEMLNEIIQDDEREQSVGLKNIETQIYDDEDVERVFKTDETEEESSKEIEDIIKVESSIESAEIEDDSHTQSSNNDEEESTLADDKESPNYFLQINTKESDETTLKRKLIYDREYLITIKSSIRCQMKPSSLVPNNDLTDIIYNESQNILCSNRKTRQITTHSRGKKQKYPSASFRKAPKLFQPKLINLTSDESQVFERLESSYLPPQLRTKDKSTDPFNELKRNIKSNLNKITPQNFQDCLLEISKLNIQEKEEMSCLINEIFIKAVQEEAYSVTYAQFCNKLAILYAENQSFKGQLLKKCQDMFETPIQDQLDNVRKEWLLKIDNELNPKIKSLYESDLEEQVKRAKDKYFGNIRFIGELFLHNLLAGKVILNCIVELLKGKDDIDSLLALCKLMETCGKQIDDRHKEQMNQFMAIIDELSTSNELETRIRFKLKDVSDMRKRHWTLRHIQQEKKINPKTLEQQKEESIAEAEASKLLVSQSSFKKPNRVNVQHNNIRRQMSVPQKPFVVKDLSCFSYNVDKPTVLGPVRNNWNTGSGSKSQRKPQAIEEWTSVQPRYAERYTDYYSRSQETSPQIKLKNKCHTLESSIDVSVSNPRSNSPPNMYPNNMTKAYRIRQRLSSMNDEERAKIIFNDLLLTGHFDVDSWIQITNAQPIIEKWIDCMMEKDASCRHSVGSTFNRLVRDKIINRMLLIKCLQNFMSCVDDLIYDIPKLWEFFAQFLECFIVDKNSNIDFIQNIFKEMLPNKNVALCISMALHAASSRLGHHIVGQVFHTSSLKWNCIVPNDWKKFVEDNDLLFTLTGGAQLSSHGGYTLQSISTDLEIMLSNHSSNEDIFDYLEQHIDRLTWKSSECSRVITSCVLIAMSRQSKSTVRSYLKDKLDIIKQVCQHKINNEVEVLRSILSVADKLDSEILTFVYDLIITSKIVSNMAFGRYLKDLSLKSQPYFELTVQIISQLSIVDDYHR